METFSNSSNMMLNSCLCQRLLWALAALQHTTPPPPRHKASYSWPFPGLYFQTTDHRSPGYPGSVVLLGLKASKKLSRGAEEQRGIVLLTLTALCMQLLYGPEEGSCTEVTGEITTPFISPDQNLLQAVGETNPVCVCVCVVSRVRLSPG